MPSIYQDGTYLASHPTWHEEDASWKAAQIAGVIRRNGLRPSSIAEIGCGTGEVLNQLTVILGGQVQGIGYEVSPQAYALCKPKERPDLQFRLADPLQPGGRTAFDIVMAIDVLEHVEDYLGFLKALRARGRHQILHIPLDISLQSVLRPRRLTTSRTKAGHLHYFTKETALATLEHAGYKVVESRFTRGALELPGRSWKARAARAPRKLLSSVSDDLSARLLGGFSLLVLSQ